MKIQIQNAKSATPRRNSCGMDAVLCFDLHGQAGALSPTPALFRWERVKRRTSLDTCSSRSRIQRWEKPDSVQAEELVAQTSKSAVSQVSQPAEYRNSETFRNIHGLPIWKSATQQVWKPALHRSAFTLLEVLIALFIMAMVMVVVHSVFYGALKLRNQTDQAFTDAIPLQHAVTLIKRDLANLTVPGGTFTGTFQTTPATGSSTSTMHYGQQAGPTFYTASGVVSDDSTWSEIQKVAYYLTPGTNGGNGMELVRSVTRNLLPVLQDEYSDQHLLSGVENLTFQYYNGTAWVDTWDSTTTSLTSSTTNTLPLGIRVQLTLAAEAGKLALAPIELVVPVAAQPSTNSTSTATSTTTGGGS